MPTFRHFLVVAILLAVVASLCGCANQDALTKSGIRPGKGVFYNCVRAGQPKINHSLSSQVIVINRDANHWRLTVGFGDGQQQVLDRVQGTTGHLFANQFYAWRVGANGNVLTDVEAISTYACTPISYAESSELVRREAHPQ